MNKIGFQNHYRVLHFTTEIGKYFIGGIGTYINEIYDTCKNETDTVGFIHLYDEDFSSEIDENLYPGKFNIISCSFSEFDKIDLSFDLAVVHYYGLQSVFQYAKNNKKPVIYVCHSIPTTEPFFINNPFGSQDEIQRKFEKACELADKIVLVSNAEMQKLRNIYRNFNFYKKCVVIYNGIKFYHEEYKKKSIKFNRKIFGFLGRMDYRKGLLECIKAIKEIDGELWIASNNVDKFYFNQIVTYIDGTNMNEKIKFIGWCTGDRKIKFLDSIDALIVPSLYEPFGYVVLESIRQGTPVICSVRGGILEIIDKYKYKFDPYLRGDLEKIILKFQNDPNDQIIDEIEYLYNRCYKHFNISIMMKKINELIGNY